MHEQYRGKRVLVTGGLGFIGSHLSERLAESGAHVTILDLPGADNALEMDLHSFSFIEKDILSPDLFAGTTPTFEYVFHLAARCDLNGKTVEDYKINYLGTLNLLRQLHQSPPLRRFVFYSTQLVAGIFDEMRFIDPSEPYKTKTPYGRSKIAGELVVKKYCSQNTIPWTIIRPTSVYGPRGREPYRDFFRQIAQNRYVHIGKAANLISMAFVDNLVDLTLIAASSTRSVGHTYYGTDFHPYTMREFANEAAKNLGVHIHTIPEFIAWIIAYGLLPFKMLGLPVPLYPFRLKNILSNYCYDIQNATEIGYAPTWNLHDGMKKSILWYLNRDSTFLQRK